MPVVALRRCIAASMAKGLKSASCKHWRVFRNRTLRDVRFRPVTKLSEIIDLQPRHDIASDR